YEIRGDWRNSTLLPEPLRKLWEKHTNLSNKKEKTHRKNGKTHRINISSMGVSTETLHTGSISGAQIKVLIQKEAVQRRLLDFLGFKDYEALFSAGKASVYSVIPPEDKHKSGGLLFADDGNILFHDFSGAGGGKHILLNSLYATLVAESPVDLTPFQTDKGKMKGKVQAATWWLRLLIDAGVVEPAVVNLPPCPVNARPALKKVYYGIKRLFEVRWAYEDHHGLPIMLGRDFLMDWCGVTEQQARIAVKDLLRQEVIYTAGKHGRSKIFLPGPR
ncbi:hypothetical protein, partial [Solemya velum gill symbiont]